MIRFSNQTELEPQAQGAARNDSAFKFAFLVCAIVGLTIVGVARNAPKLLFGKEDRLERGRVLDRSEHEYSLASTRLQHRKFVGGNNVTDGAIHIVYAAEDGHVAGLRASIYSLVSNTGNPGAITLHLFHLLPQNATWDGSDISPDGMTKMTKKLLSIDFLQWIESKGSAVRAYIYTKQDVAPFINTHNEYRNLQSPTNYVRFLLPGRLLGIDSCLWMDSDTIIEGDVVPFLNSHGKTHPVSAFPTNFNYINRTVRQKLANRGVDVAPMFPSFCAGIMIMNLEQWRARNYIEEIKDICKINRRFNLWPTWGSQPPILIKFGGDRFEQLDKKKYSVTGLGWKNKTEIPDSAIFLHWTSALKPWLENGLNKKFWEPYDLFGTSQ